MEFQALANGYRFLEAPRVDEQDNVYFAVLIGGGIQRRSPDGELTSFLPDRHWIGGIVLNHDGAVICSGMGGLLLFDPVTGASRPLLSEIDGQAVTAVNDIEADDQGSIFGGTIDFASIAAGKPPAPGFLFRLDPSGTATRLGGDVPAPNGLAFSADGRTLYVSETGEGILAYEMAPDRTFQSRRLVAALPDSDGIAIDEQGGIWVATWQSGKLLRFRPDGTLDRTIEFPVEQVVSLTFGGADRRDLHVVTGSEFANPESRTGTLYRARSDIPGLAVSRARF
jgi:sugar lactone lactonase YvrE